MRKKLHKILVTGGAGFIGSAFVRNLAKKAYRIVVCDKLTYAGDQSRLKEVEGKYKFYHVDICDKKRIESIFEKEKPEVLVHFAAETHVDRSILDSAPFTKTNIIGTQVLLDLSRIFGLEKFIHISTDEVYGDITQGKFNEDSPLKPNSPYAASKAAADLLIKSYVRTYNFPAVIVRPCNNYGPWQYPEKLIPLAILKILRREQIPIYAAGRNIREWLYVEDCAEGIFEIFKNGRRGEVYNLGSGEEKQNIEVAKSILNLLHIPQDMIRFVKDRPGHDFRYSLDSRKLSRQIDWKPAIRFNEGIKLTVAWCLRHKDWLFNKH